MRISGEGSSGGISLVKDPLVEYLLVEYPGEDLW